MKLGYNIDAVSVGWFPHVKGSDSLNFENYLISQTGESFLHQKKGG
jgi:hypothetical protein